MSSEARLQRQLEHNKRLREQYELVRVPVSQAGNELIKYCQGIRDIFVPQVWGELNKGEDPFVVQTSGCACSVM